MPPPADPMAVARELLNGRSQALRSWRGGSMTWRGPCWAEAEAAEIRSWIYHVLEHAVVLVKVKQRTASRRSRSRGSRTGARSPTWRTH